MLSKAHIVRIILLAICLFSVLSLIGCQLNHHNDMNDKQAGASLEDTRLPDHHSNQDIQPSSSPTLVEEILDEVHVASLKSKSWGEYTLVLRDGVAMLNHNESGIPICQPSETVFLESNVLIDMYESMDDGAYISILSGGEFNIGGYTDITIIELEDDGTFSDQPASYYNINNGTAEQLLMESITIKAQASCTDGGNSSVLSVEPVNHVFPDSAVKLTVFGEWKPYYMYDRIVSKTVSINESNFGDGWPVSSMLCFPDTCIEDGQTVVLTAYLNYKNGDFFYNSFNGSPVVNISLLSD